MVAASREDDHAVEAPVLIGDELHRALNVLSAERVQQQQRRGRYPPPLQPGPGHLQGVDGPKGHHHVGAVGLVLLHEGEGLVQVTAPEHEHDLVP